MYLPLYAAGVIGPAVGAAVTSVAGAAGPFWLGGAVFIAGAIVVWLRVRPNATAPQAVEPPAGRRAD